MTSLYFWFNAVAYAVFAVWCTVRPEQTAAFLGLQLDGWKGQSEYVAVYGGIEAAFAAFFVTAALKPAWHGPALGFATFLYGGLVLFRTIVFVRSGFSIGGAVGPYVFEWIMVVLAILLWRRHGI